MELRHLNVYIKISQRGCLEFKDYVRRLQDIKSIDIILEALYRVYYKCNLRIIGDGEVCQELMKITEYLGLQRQCLWG